MTEEQNELRINLQQRMVKCQIWHCCLNCLEWSGKSNKCMKYGMIPPPEIIVNSCSEYDPDIPF